MPFAYAVKDEPSCNDFGHWETSDGKAVTGSYSVVLPDGRKQTVIYKVDACSGYVANVQYEGIAYHPVAASYSPPVVKAAYVAPEVEAVLVKEDVVEKVAPASPVYDAKVEAKEAEPIAAPVIKEAETAPPAPEKAYERFAISPAEFTVERFLLLI
jgi:hypothetical protein